MILDKLAQPKAHLNRDDLTPNQKKHLWVVMQRHDATQGFSYDRFFKEGFKEWELRGIDRIKKDFLQLHEKELWTTPEEDGTIGYAGVLAFIDDNEHCFYDLIGRVGLKMVFTAYMGELGMGSNTVLERFGKAQEEDFKDYERIGILAVIEEFEQEVEGQNIE